MHTEIQEPAQGHFQEWHRRFLRKDRRLSRKDRVGGPQTWMSVGVASTWAAVDLERVTTPSSLNFLICKMGAVYLTLFSLRRVFGRSHSANHDLQNFRYPGPLLGHVVSR